jgi:uncharacterized linocin/CFP29 family protein
MEEAVVSGTRSMTAGKNGKWAAERWIKALKEGRPLSSVELRTNDTLRKDEWKAFDTAVIEEAAIRLRGVADLIAAGLTIPVPNAIGKTIFEYEKMTDLEDAIVSMTGVVRSENDRVDFSAAGVPLPITHKDFNLDLRHLAGSRTSGEPLDTVNARLAGRKVGEKTEEMLFIGGKTWAGLTIYGYTTHPNRNTSAFGTGGAWTGAKTGAEILADVNTMKAGLDGDRMPGPYALYVGSAANLHLDNDFKATSDRTIRERLLTVDGITSIRSSDKMPAAAVVMVQMTRDVVVMLDGEPLQTVQWDVNGGFEIAFKAWQILIPLLRADAQGRSGIFHMS